MRDFPDYRELRYIEHLILKDISRTLKYKTLELCSLLEKKESELSGVDRETLSKMREIISDYENAKANMEKLSKETLTEFEKMLDKFMNESDVTEFIKEHFSTQIEGLVETALTDAKNSGEFDGASITITNITESDNDGGYNIVTFSDGSTLRIRNGIGGSGSGGEVVKNYYTIISNLTNVTSSSDVTEVEENASYTAILSTAGTMESVVVTMGGVDITSTVYDSATGVITIPSVTGHINITASAVLDETKIYYSITHNLTNVSASSNVNQVEEGKSYSVTLTPSESYTMQNVVVRMGGTDITSTVYTSGTGTISIPSVTGDVTITASAEMVVKTYSITYDFGDHCMISTAPTQINEGESFINSLSFDNGYEFDTCTITMGGVNADSYFNPETLVINIPSVTGDLVITVQAKEEVINDTTDCADALTTYGYVTNTHVDQSTGAESSMGGESSTNYIKVKNGDILYMSGVNPFGMYGTTIYFVYFDVNKSRIGSESYNGAPSQFTINCEGVAYVRITQLASLGSAKLSVNNPIS